MAARYTPGSAFAPTEKLDPIYNASSLAKNKDNIELWLVQLPLEVDVSAATCKVLAKIKEGQVGSVKTAEGAKLRLVEEDPGISSQLHATFPSNKEPQYSQAIKISRRVTAVTTEAPSRLVPAEAPARTPASPPPEQPTTPKSKRKDKEKKSKDKDKDKDGGERKEKRRRKSKD